MLDHQSASEPQWPLTGKAAMYTRGATHATRTHLPLTDDVLVLAQERGYTPEHITIYEDVAVVSGKTPMMSREGLRALVTAIEQGSIQTVVVADESRLFQEADMLQISLFLKACFEHDVVVVTAQTVYDFTNPALGHALDPAVGKGDCTESGRYRKGYSQDERRSGMRAAKTQLKRTSNMKHLQLGFLLFACALLISWVVIVALRIVPQVFHALHVF
jgi:Resolvase, N terminal domain